MQTTFSAIGCWACLRKKYPPSFPPPVVPAAFLCQAHRFAEADAAISPSGRVRLAAVAFRAKLPPSKLPVFCGRLFCCGNSGVPMFFTARRREESSCFYRRLCAKIRIRQIGGQPSDKVEGTCGARFSKAIFRAGVAIARFCSVDAAFVLRKNAARAGFDYVFSSRLCLGKGQKWRYSKRRQFCEVES